MKTTIRNEALVNLYADVMQRPVSQRYNMKELILDSVPRKRILFQVFMPLRDVYHEPQREGLEQMSISDLRFINFLENTDFTSAELTQIFKEHESTCNAIPEKYKCRAPIQSKAFAVYARKFGRPANVSVAEREQLYEKHD